MQRRRSRWIARGACAVSVVLFCAVFSNTAFLNEIGIKDYLWNQNIAFEDNGLLLSAVYSTKYLQVEQPEDYSADAAQQIIDETPQPDPVTPAQQKPNLIVIMNESLYDLQTAGSFETDLDYMPFLHSLAGQPNTITGQLRVSTFGGGTCNTEFEFLTGNTSASSPPAASSISSTSIARPPLLRPPSCRRDTPSTRYIRFTAIAGTATRSTRCSALSISTTCLTSPKRGL